MNSNFPDALTKLIAASTRYTIAKQEHADRGGYNWSYVGWDYSRTLDLAMEEFEDELNKLIDSRINDVLSKMREPQA